MVEQNKFDEKRCYSARIELGSVKNITCFFISLSLSLSLSSEAWPLFQYLVPSLSFFHTYILFFCLKTRLRFHKKKKKKIQNSVVLTFTKKTRKKISVAIICFLLDAWQWLKRSVVFLFSDSFFIPSVPNTSINRGE